MAIQKIVSSIDAYIATLKAARKLLTAPYTPLETIHREAKKLKRRGKPRSIQLPVQSPSTLQVAVQIVPARVPRRRERLAKPLSQRFSALGGPIPKEPVVIRSSDLARMRPETGRTYPTVAAKQPTPSGGSLEELAQEVAKRLASGRTLPHRV